MEVTIICPTFNRGAAISKTIQSVQNQIIEDWSMIVVSDASTDATDLTVQQIAMADRRIRLIRSEHNFGGPSRPTNTAIKQLDTEWVAYIDHDDLWHPQHLQTLSLAAETGADVVSTQATHVDAQDNVLIAAEPLNCFWHPWLQLIAPIFHNSTVAHKTDLFEVAGGWDESGSGLEDWDLWLRFADSGAKFQAVATDTVTVVRSGSTLSSTLPMSSFYPAVRFGSGLDARRYIREFRRPENTRRLNIAAYHDTYELLRKLDRSSELIHPLRWDTGLETAIQASMRKTAALDLAQAVALEMRLHSDQFVVGWPMITMSPEHTERIVSLGPELFARTHQILDELRTKMSLS